MKTIKALFAILFLSTMFLSCEAESINDEVGIEFNDETYSNEDANDNPLPPTK